MSLCLVNSWVFSGPYPLDHGSSSLSIFLRRYEYEAWPPSPFSNSLSSAASCLSVKSFLCYVNSAEPLVLVSLTYLSIFSPHFSTNGSPKYVLAYSRMESWLLKSKSTATPLKRVHLTSSDMYFHYSVSRKLKKMLVLLLRLSQRGMRRFMILSIKS